VSSALEPPLTVIRGTRIVLPDLLGPASIHIAGGTIVRVASYEDTPEHADLVDLGDLIVSPGIVDTHVHVNEPGRTGWEGFETATCAAAAGGVTTLVDMPLNSIPATTTVRGLLAKREAADRQCHVDVAFWGGVVPGNTGELDGLIDAGVRGFKCFLVPSGVDEFPAVDESELRRAMPVLARRRATLLVHAESPAVIEAHAPEQPHAAPKDEASGRGAGLARPMQPYSAYLRTRPPEAEVEAIRMMARLASEFGVRTHIVHVAAAGAVEEIARAQDEGAPITAETCPHYLTFSAGEIADGATAFKCAPPIRGASDREALWKGLRRGVLGLVATDHSPAPPALKTPGDFLRAWGGIASLELSLAVVWTGASARGFGVGDLARWMSAATAALAGLSDRKGAIEAGRDADLIGWAPDAEFVVDPDSLQQRHKLTPYAGMRLRGIVQRTFLRGRSIWDRNQRATAPSGRLI
jgi:allantoinase